MTTVVDYDVAMEIAAHEAIVRQAYKDSEGVWTWSVGLTSATGHMVERYIGKPQSLEHCLRVYVWALDNYADAVRKAFAGTKLTKAQFAAALSFHWNTGSIAKASWVKKFKAGDIAGARKAFMDWRKPAAIIPRREKERDLFFDGKWSNNGTMNEYTRVKANGAPDWESVKRINVEAELRAALRDEIPASDKVIVEQPVPVEVPVDKPVVPEKVEKEVRQKTSWGAWLLSLFGIGTGGASWLADADNELVIILIIAGAVCAGVLLFAGEWIVRRVKSIRKEIET